MSLPPSAASTSPFGLRPLLFPGSSSTEPSERTARLLLALLLSVGLLARVGGVTYGLPDLYHPDEARIVDRAVRFHSGDLNPRFFNWPSLYMYVLSGVYGVVFGALGGGGRTEVVSAFARDAVPFYVLGRVVTATFGAGTIVALYVAAVESYRVPVALLASLFLSLNLLHIRESHFITTDVPLTFLITLALVFVLRYGRAGRAPDAVWSGLLSGLAASMKYPGGLMLLPFTVAHLVRPRPIAAVRERRILDGKLILGLAAAALGFAIGTPYALLTPRAFASGVASELGEVGSVQFGNEADLPAYLFHLGHSLPQAMGIPLLICALVGLLLALVRRTPRELVLLAFPLPYFVVIASWDSRFERYALPLLPFLALFAALGLVTAATRIRDRRWTLVDRSRPGLGLALATVLLLAPEVARVAYFHVLLARPDTRVLAAEWIEREIPPGSRIALEPYTPSLPTVPAARGYRVSRLSPYDVDGLLARDVEYVVLSGFMYQRHQGACERFPDECRFYREVQARAALLLALEPGVDGPRLWVGDIYAPLTNLFARTRPGPSIRIYRLARRHEA